MTGAVVRFYRVSADDASLNRANISSIINAQYGIIQIGVLYYFWGIEKVFEHGEM